MIFHKYFIITPLYYSFGDSARQIFWGYARARQLNKKIIVVEPARITQLLNYKICNIPLFQLNFNYIPTLEDKIFKFITFLLFNSYFILVRSVALLCVHFFRFRPPEHFFFPQFGLADSYYLRPSIDFEQLKSSNKLLLSLIHSPPFPSFTPFLDIKARAQFNQLIPAGQKYVCLHVRDSSFFSDSSKRPYRNSDIDTYIDSIKFLIDKGLYVIRLGNPEMKECTFKHPNYIEYSHSSCKTESLDLFLIKNCFFYVGMQSGPSELANLFNVPIILTNAVDYMDGLPLKPTDRMTLKQRVNLNSKKYIRPDELLSLDVSEFDPWEKSQDLYHGFVSHRSDQLYIFISSFYRSLVECNKSMSYSDVNTSFFSEWSIKYFDMLIHCEDKFVLPSIHSRNARFLQLLAAKGLIIYPD